MLAGSVVVSMCGRDKGGMFCVVECVDETYVRIANGKRRRTENPKRKKIKHLNVLYRASEPVPITGGTAGNHDVKMILKSYQHILTENREG